MIQYLILMWQIAFGTTRHWNSAAGSQTARRCPAPSGWSTV